MTCGRIAAKQHRNTFVLVVMLWARATFHTGGPASSGTRQARVSRMPATVFAEPVSSAGARSSFSENVARFRPQCERAAPCDRVVDLRGEQVQCDLWFPGQLAPDHGAELQSFPEW